MSVSHTAVLDNTCPHPKDNGYHSVLETAPTINYRIFLQLIPAHALYTVLYTVIQGDTEL